MGARHASGIDGAARRAGFQQAHGLVDGGFHRHQPAAGMHQEDRRAIPAALQLRDQPPQIIRNQRLHIGVRDHRVEAWQFPHLRRHHRRDRNGQIGRGAAERVLDHTLMYVIGIGMHQAHRNRLILPFRDPHRKRVGLRRIQRQQHAAIRCDPLGQGEAMLPRDQRRGEFEVQVILLEPVFRAHLDHVAKALGCDEGRLRPAPLDQGVRDKRRAVDDLPDLRKRDPGLCAASAMPVRIARSGRS
jgi:hypothetical protein